MRYEEDRYSQTLYLLLYCTSAIIFILNKGADSLVTQIILDETVIPVKNFETKQIDELTEIDVIFDVKSEDYHRITTLLYYGSFQVEVPEADLQFYGAIQQYSTSLTNLYEANQVGEFRLVLREVNKQ